MSSPSRVIATRLFFNDLRPYFRPCMPLAAVGFRLTVEPPGALARRAPLLRDPVHHLPSICLRSLILGALQLIRHLHGGGRAGSKIHVGLSASLVASLFGDLRSPCKKKKRRVWGLWRLERVITDCVDEGYWAKGGDVASPPAERVVRGALSGNPKRRANRHVAAHERDGDAGRPLFRR